MSPEISSRVQNVGLDEGRLTLNLEKTYKLMTAQMESGMTSKVKSTMHRKVEPNLVTVGERLSDRATEQQISVSPSATDEGVSGRIQVDPITGAQSKSITPRKHFNNSGRNSATDEYQTQSLCNTARNKHGMANLTHGFYTQDKQEPAR